MSETFVIPGEKSQVLRGKKRHVQFLFDGVQIRILESNAGKQWISLSCSDESKKEELKKAKKYIDALCGSAESDTIILPLQLDEYPAFTIQENIFNLEKDFSVVATVSGNSRKLLIKGSEFDVVRAKSWIDKHYSSLFKVNQEVDDVTDAALNPSLKEFAFKLGYSEEVVNSVAKKLGAHVDQNKLLRELIHYTGTSRIDPRAIDVPRGPSPGQIVARGARSVSSTSQRAAETQIWDSTRGADGAIVARGASPMTLSSHTQSLSSGNSLVPIVIDGSNVAMHHGNQKVFSCRGIELCIKWFRERGHKEIYAFVPSWRTGTPRQDYPISDQHILHELAEQNFVKFTPSRRIGGRNIVCYDDRFIVELAYKISGIVVSNDNYRDLQKEHPEWKDVIEKRLLMYSFVGDYFMPPDDPLGKHGPTLKVFLQKGTQSHPRICPHIPRCTYGLKCRYYHPERDPNQRQELFGGRERQVDRNSTIYDTRNRLTNAMPQEFPNQQQPWHYASPSSFTTSQRFTYLPPYNSYNNSSCQSTQDEQYEHIVEKVHEVFGEDKEKLARALEVLPSVYNSTKNKDAIINILFEKYFL